MLRNSKQPRVAPAGPPYDAATSAALEALGPPIALFRVFARRPDRAMAIHAALFGGKAGLDAAQLRSLAAGGASDACWAEEDRAVIAAVDALCDRGDLDDREWDALVRAAGEEGAVDLLLVCGWYHAISFVARALRLPLEPGTEAHALSPG